MERAAISRKIARSDAIDRYVPLPDVLRRILVHEADVALVKAAAARRFLGTAFNLRLGVPRQLQLPPESLFAAGGAVILHVPPGQRVEHLLCAHISGDLWYCHPGSPKDGDLHSTIPFATRDLVVRDISWQCKRPLRTRLRGRTVKRDLAAIAVKHKSCFELVVAYAKWKAEVHRARERGGHRNIYAATAGIDFEAPATPWSAVVAVWQWAENLCDQVGMQMRYAIHSSPLHIVRALPEHLVPDV